MARRGAMELSVSTLIVMILGMTILFGGIILVWKIVAIGDDTASRLSADAQGEIDDLLAQGKRVAVAPAIQAVEAGETVVYGVGILNKLDGEKEFGIEVRVLDEDEQEQSGWAAHFDTITIARDREDTALIRITPSEDAPPGEYLVFVTVTAEQQPYDSTRFFTVKVS